MNSGRLPHAVKAWPTCGRARAIVATRRVVTDLLECGRRDPLRWDLDNLLDFNVAMTAYPRGFGMPERNRSC